MMINTCFFFLVFFFPRTWSLSIVYIIRAARVWDSSAQRRVPSVRPGKRCVPISSLFFAPPPPHPNRRAAKARPWAAGETSPRSISIVIVRSHRQHAARVRVTQCYDNIILFDRRRRRRRRVSVFVYYYLLRVRWGGELVKNGFYIACSVRNRPFTGRSWVGTDR